MEETIFRNNRTGKLVLHGIRYVGISSTVPFRCIDHRPPCYTAGTPSGTPEEIDLDIFWGATQKKS
ncbi:MAG: hypothetical protein QG606_531 [Patescibacteria group bacterium]|nr:hypothetical protein [Patescibacteria group bacterium]